MVVAVIEGRVAVIEGRVITNLATHHLLVCIQPVAT